MGCSAMLSYIVYDGWKIPLKIALTQYMYIKWLKPGNLMICYISLSSTKIIKIQAMAFMQNVIDSLLATNKLIELHYSPATGLGIPKIHTPMSKANNIFFKNHNYLELLQKSNRYYR